MQEHRIKVIDSVMGSGKSTFAVNYVNDHIDENFIIVVPTKAEQRRYRDQLDRDVFLPTLEDGNSRLLHSFNDAVAENKTIVTTHKLLECWDSTSINEIKNRRYTLILDEVIDVVNPVKVSQCDFEALLKSGYIQTESNGSNGNLISVKAVEGKEYSGEIHKFWEQVKNNNVYQSNGTYYVWVAPPEKLKAFDDVFILTYLFHGQQFKGWLDIHRIPYSLHSIVNNELASYQRPSGAGYKGLVTVNTDKKLNDAYSRHGSLSSTWHDRAKPKYLNQLQNDIRSFFRSVTKTESSQNLVTTFKGYERNLLREPFMSCSKGFRLNQVSKLTDEEKAESYCCLPHNAKATNLYAHKTAIAYPVNVFPRPEIDAFLSCNLEKHNGKQFQDLYALSTMIQFIWRSCIRNGQPIHVYVPSKRMRNLLLDWLNDELLCPE